MTDGGLTPRGAIETALNAAIESLGLPATLALGGLTIGAAFGAAAQRSRFCLRAAAVEFGRGSAGVKLAVWLSAFGAALLATQTALAVGLILPDMVRQLRAPGSLSAPIIGGLIFGVGMTLARACPSRMLVLSGQGNLRALVAGMVFAVVAAASYRGLLSPARLWLHAALPIDADSRDLGALIGLGPAARIGLGVAFLGAGLALARRRMVAAGEAVAALRVGLAVAAAWVFTAIVARVAFDQPTPVNGVAFSGPSSDFLLRVVSPLDRPLDFDTGLVPGVFLGALAAALVSRSFAWESFGAQAGLPRYLIGAALMGFGAMLAGGCAVGAGVTGGAVLSSTAWIALAAMWIGGMAADRMIDAPVNARSFFVRKVAGIG